MDIHGGFTGIRSPQLYRTSSDKQKHIKDAIDTLFKLDVISPSNSPVAMMLFGPLYFWGFDNHEAISLKCCGLWKSDLKSGR